MKEDDDQLLTDHRSETHPTVYFIHRLANFREQTALAVKLVQAAFRKGIFKKRSTLLIIGGGISGVAAGLEASKRGMIVTLFESKPTLLSVNQRCTSRHLHPYEYEWPLDHYKTRRFPFTKRDKRYCPKPMRWTAGAASLVAKTMAQQIESEAPTTLSFNLGVRHIPVNLDTLLNDFDPDGDYKFILVCAGASERTRIGSSEFASFPYWAEDPLETICSAHKSDRSPLRILLSGGGDGGLQDLLRIITQHPKGELFAAGRLLSKLLRALRQSSNFNGWVQAKQGNWDAYRPDPNELYEELNTLLDSIQADTRSWNLLVRALRKSIHPFVINGEVNVQVAFKGATFSDSFTLNVFLVLLVSRIVTGHQWLRPNCEIESVYSAVSNHSCAGTPKDCFKKLHCVKWKAGDVEEFDIVVLRHGSDQALSNVSNGNVNSGTHSNS